ncbi:MAG: tetratricopeptide repeat protein [Solirubrobacterales bacterium]
MAERDEEAALAGAAAVARLDGITRLLRRDCPWDRVQDARSIVPHTVEEAYELADAAAAGDDAKILDELGDVLFQVHFLALLLEEGGGGDLAAVADATSAKLIRRHPHVFADGEAADSEEVLTNWDRIKREKEGRPGLFEDVPENLPALLHARKLQRRASSRASRDAELGSVGADGSSATLERIEAETSRLRGLIAAGADAGPEDASGSRDEVEAAVGELLFASVDLARRVHCDPELALRASSARFRAAAELPAEREEASGDPATDEDREDWERRVAGLKASMEQMREEDFLAAMEALVGELSADDPAGIFERAGALDSTGHSDRAVELYERALGLGLGEDRRRQAVIQLASSLRNLDRTPESVALLSAEMKAGSDHLDDAVRAFLALALADSGREREALALVLGALSEHMTRYSRSVGNYAQDLLGEAEPQG